MSCHVVFMLKINDQFSDTIIILIIPGAHNEKRKGDYPKLLDQGFDCFTILCILYRLSTLAIVAAKALSVKKS